MRTTFSVNIQRTLSLISWSFLILVIEAFFVIAPIRAGFVEMALLMLVAVGAACIAFFRRVKKQMEISFLTALFFVLHLFITMFALKTGTSRSMTDLFFYWSGILIMIAASEFYNNSEKCEDFIMNLLTVFGLFFALGVVLQMLFTDTFLRIQISLLNSDYSSSLRRQVFFHQMYTGWTTQTFATCIDLMLGIFGALALWEKTGKRRYFIALLFMFFAYLLTGKRGPLVFLLLAIFLVSLLSSKNIKQVIKRFWKSIILFLSAGIALVSFIFINGSNSRNTIVRFIELFNSSGLNGDDASNGRFELWGFAINLFLKKPITGIGWRKYHEYALAYLSEDIEAHNVYLQLLAELGIIGFFLYVSVILYGMYFTYKLMKQAQKYHITSCFRLMKLSLMIQLFMFLYANTGNTLYDYCAHICYYFAFSLCIYVKHNINFNLKEQLQQIYLMKE